MVGLLLTTVGLLVFTIGLALLVVFSATSLSLLQRGGRWRGRNSYLTMTGLMIVLSLTMGMAVTSLSPFLNHAATTDLGTGLVFLGSVIAAGLALAATCAVLPARRRAPRARPRRLHRVASVVLRVAGRVLLWAAIPLGLWFGWWIASGEGPVSAVIDFVLAGGSAAFCLAAVAVGLTYFGERLTPPPLEAVVAADPRPPVLYLRGFAEEESWFAADASGRGQTIEEFLGPAVRDALGPLVALGSPEDRVPPQGAVRIYCRDGEWQETAARLMADAACVLLAPASTENVGWELNRLAELRMSAKLHIVLPPASLGGEGREPRAREAAEAAPSAREPAESVPSARHLFVRAFARALRHYFGSRPSVDDAVIAGSSAVGAPLAFAPARLPSHAELSARLVAAGLIPLPEPAPAGTVIGFAGAQAIVVASGLCAPEEFVAAIHDHLLAAAEQGAGALTAASPGSPSSR